MKYERLRKQLARFGKRIADEHLVVGPGGNISARIRNRMLIKASGVPLEEARPEDYIALDIATGTALEKGGRPSSEVPMHLACYRVRPDVGAVVHTHPPFATGVACAGVTLRPMFPDFVAIIGSDVPTLPFVIPCGEELAMVVSQAVSKANAALMGNHGAITVGANLREAFYRAMLLEVAAQGLVAGTIVGKMRYLSREEVDTIRGLAKVEYRVSLLKQGK